MMPRLSAAAGALLAGTVCLLVLFGVLVSHAWPLWTGETIILPVVPVDPRDLFRGEYVRLATPASRLTIRAVAGEDLDAGTAVVVPDPSWSGYDAETTLVGTDVFIQMAPVADSNESRPVSISRERRPGHVNLRGRVTYAADDRGVVTIDYGLERYYMEEGTAGPIENAIRERRKVQMEIAVASSGRARIRRLLVDGVAQ